jgi:hypothetical protein
MLWGKEKFLAPSKNQTPAAHPVTILTELSQLQPTHLAFKLEAVCSSETSVSRHKTACVMSQKIVVLKCGLLIMTEFVKLSDFALSEGRTNVAK